MTSSRALAPIAIAIAIAIALVALAASCIPEDDATPPRPVPPPTRSVDPPPPAAPKLDGSDERPGPLVLVETTGGKCASGTCTSQTIIGRDGSVNTGGDVRKATLSALKRAMNDADYRALAAKPFMGTCPTASDGVETIYTFNVGDEVHELRSCTVEIDTNAKLFKALNAALESAKTSLAAEGAAPAPAPAP